MRKGQGICVEELSAPSMSGKLDPCAGSVNVKLLNLHSRKIIVQGVRFYRNHQKYFKSLFLEVQTCAQFVPISKQTSNLAEL